MYGNDSNDYGCPHQYNCTPERASFSIGTAPSYVSLVSSSFSCLGSVLIVLAFLMLPEIRTGAQKLITLLAIADFISAFGYFVAAVNFLQHYVRLKDETEAELHSRQCETFHLLCKAQSFVTTTSSLCSFLWTMFLAVYFHVVIVNKQTLVLGKKTFVLINLISWGGPLIITIPLLARDHLGYTQLSTANWCFVRDTPGSSIKRWLLIVLVLVAGKFWEILSYIVVTILYISISISLYRSRRKLAIAQNSGGSRMSQEHVELRLLSIPIAFLLLRLWGTTQFFYSLQLTNSSKVPQCISKSQHTVLLVLGIMQAVGDSGQGWSNAVLYIFLSPTIRTWFICECISGCCSRLRTLYRICGIEISGYSRFSNDPSIVNGPDVRQHAVNGTYIDRRKQTSFNRSDSRSLYGAAMIADDGSQHPQAVTKVKAPEDAAHGREDAAKSGKMRGREELLDTASLKHQTC